MQDFPGRSISFEFIEKIVYLILAIILSDLQLLRLGTWPFVSSLAY